MLHQHASSIEQEYTSNQDISRKKRQFYGKIKKIKRNKKKTQSKTKN